MVYNNGVFKLWCMSQNKVLESPECFYRANAYICYIQPNQIKAVSSPFHGLCCLLGHSNNYGMQTVIIYGKLYWTCILVGIGSYNITICGFIELSRLQSTSLISTDGAIVIWVFTVGSSKTIECPAQLPIFITSNIVLPVC